MKSTTHFKGNDDRLSGVRKLTHKVNKYIYSKIYTVYSKLWLEVPKCGEMINLADHMLLEFK